MSTSSNSHNSSPTNSPKPTSPTTSTTTTTTVAAATTTSSPTKTQAAIESLSSILPTPFSISSSSSPSAAFLLTSHDVSTQITTLLRHPSSGSGDNHLCRWLYDTFQSSDPSLQLVILRFIPLISGLYLTRISQRKPLAGFEAVLLALYAHETTLRDGQAVSVTIPNMSYPSIYHETNHNNTNNNNNNNSSTSNSNSNNNNSATDLDIAVVSPSLEPHGTVRSTRRARIVGVALEMFYSKIWVMPVQSKLDFCEFFEIWTGEGEKSKVDGKKLGRIPLPWELLQPCLRILGHCLLSEYKHINNSTTNNNNNNNGSGSELHEMARKACKSMYVRAMHDVNPKAILAAGSLLKIVKIEDDLGDFDPTEITNARVISV